MGRHGTHPRLGQFISHDFFLSFKFCQLLQVLHVKGILFVHSVDIALFELHLVLQLLLLLLESNVLLHLFDVRRISKLSLFLPSLLILEHGPSPGRFLL